ncbi:unnamed protein product, partial [Choristocarpus tenellus]
GVGGLEPTLNGLEEEVGDESQPIQPRVGVSLLWQEASCCPEPAEHVFCAWEKIQGMEGGGDNRQLLICLVEPVSRRLRALSVPSVQSHCLTPVVNPQSAQAPNLPTHTVNKGRGVKEVFIMPCLSAVGVCTTARGGRCDVGGGIESVATDILLLTLDGCLEMYQGRSQITKVYPCIPRVWGELGDSEAASSRSGHVTPLLDMGSGDNSASNRDECYVGSGSPGTEPEHLSDAAGGCFTLTLRNGQCWRMRLSMEPTSSLVAACLGAWDALLSPQLASTLRADVMGMAQVLLGNGRTVVPSTKSVKRGGEGGGRKAGVEAEDTEWSALVQVLQELVLDTTEQQSGGDLPREQLGVRKRDGKGKGKGKGKEKAWRDPGGEGEFATGWDALLGSQFHGQYARENAMLLLSISCDLKEGSVEVKEGSCSAEPLLRLETSTTGFIAEVDVAMDALHLVLEDLKTCSLTVALVPRLGSLLLSLARLCPGLNMRDFIDHYRRDAGEGDKASMLALPQQGVGEGVPKYCCMPERPTRFRKVPCIHTWIQQRVRTGRVVWNETSAAILGATLSGSLARGRSEGGAEMPCLLYDGEDCPFPTLARGCGAAENTRKLCRFYISLCNVGDLLGDKAGAAAAGLWTGRGAGARLVFAMVGEGFGAADLGRVPLGMALPLMEVLHAARSQAPTDWPAEAQRLVGREDLAALRCMLAGVSGKKIVGEPVAATDVDGGWSEKAG